MAVYAKQENFRKNSGIELAQNWLIPAIKYPAEFPPIEI